MDKSLLQRYVEGNVSQEEADEVVDWLDADPAHVDEFMALHKLHDILLMNKTVFRAEEKRGRKLRWLPAVREILKIAAVFLLAWSIQWWTDTKNEEELYQTLYVPAGQRAELLLPDSTQVWLNAHTTLVYPTTFRQKTREVQLDGEAYFKVKRNEKQPFIVKTSKTDIEVLGTEFNVFAYREEEDFSVALLKGSVMLHATDGNSFRMRPGEQIHYANGAFHTTPIEEMDYFKWKDGQICFHNATIEDIMKKLSLYFDVQIELKNKKLGEEHYTGKFWTKDGVEQVLRVLQLELHFHYTREYESNKITIK